MPVKGFEDCLQKAMSQQHARGCDIHNRDSFLRRDGLEEILAMWRSRRDSCPLTRRIERVKDEHRNIFLDRRQHGGRMQDLGPEVGELSSFVEADDLYAACVGTQV